MINPPRINLKSEDSLYSKMKDKNYCFLDVLEMLSDNIVIFYQIC